MRLNKFIAFLKLIRWFHEVVALIPFIALFLTLNYFVSIENVDCNISAIDFIVLCICVQLLIATGCILNDIMDRNIDKINKPQTHIVNNHFTLKQVIFFFVIFSLLSLILSIYICFYFFREWSWISGSVYISSILYNVYLKRTPLFGNILIALMAGFIPIVIFYFARDCFEMLDNQKMEIMVYAYAAISFLIIIPRELSLDISDIEGDKRDGCKTLPILIGERKSKIVVQFFILIIHLSGIVAIINFPHLLYPVVAIILCLIYYQIWLTKCQQRIDYIRAGRFLWAIMIFGLIGFSIVTIFPI